MLSFHRYTIILFLTQHYFIQISGDFIAEDRWNNNVEDYIIGHIFSQEVFDKVVTAYQENAFVAILTAAFTPIPYKVFTIAAGVTKISFLTLVIASAIGRSSRFFIVAILLYYFGPMMKEKIEKYFDWVALAFFALLIAGFLAVKYLI